MQKVVMGLSNSFRDVVSNKTAVILLSASFLLGGAGADQSYAKNGDRAFEQQVEKVSKALKCLSKEKYLQKVFHTPSDTFPSFDKNIDGRSEKAIRKKCIGGASDAIDSALKLCFSSGACPVPVDSESYNILKGIEKVNDLSKKDFSFDKVTEKVLQAIKRYNESYSDPGFMK